MSTAQVINKIRLRTQLISSYRGTRRPSSFRLTDHHIAKFTFTAFIKALHFDIIRGLVLQMIDEMPLLVSFHDISLVVTVIVTVCRSIVDIKSLNGSVVVT